MSRLNSLRELILSRLREFFREPEAVFWVYVFPVILAIGLGIAFREEPEISFRVGIVIGEKAEWLERVLKEEEDFTSEVLPEPDGRQHLARGRLDVVVVFEGGSYRYLFEPKRAESRLAREKVDGVIQRASGRKDAVSVEEVALDEVGTRYIDFLLPGLIGMNLMGGGIFGVGFVIVDMRVRKLLKRFLATPMHRADFFLAILLSRLVFLIPEMLFLLSIAMLGFGMPLQGSYLELSVLILTSALSFCGLGLLLATRARRLESLSGWSNLVMLPMWLLSGIFFSSERFPDFMQPFIQALPLTATNDALRAITLDGASLWSQSHELVNLALWGIASFLVSLKIFRWL